MNQALLLGNVANDPEFKTFRDGNEVCNFRFATNERWRDQQSGERKEKAEFHNIAVFNENLIKIIRQYVKKGSKLLLQGKIQTRNWEDQQGTKRYTTEIVLNKFGATLTMLSTKGEDQASHDQQAPVYRQTLQERQAEIDHYNRSQDELADEIPF